MKRFSLVHGILLVVLCTLLAAGCAKKPAPAPTTSESEAPVETSMTGGSVSGVQETGVSESMVSDQQSMMKDEMPVAGLERIHFDFDQFTLSSQARDTLTANAAFLQANPGLRIRIEGHCDERGSDEYNLALGERRANAAKDYLVSLGVAGSRLETISYGEELPLDPSGTEEAWAKNRRAEFKALR